MADLDKKTRYIPLSQWDKYHPWPSVGGLRALIKKKDKGGFEKTVIKVGKRLLIDEKAFFEWVESYRGKNLWPKNDIIG